MSNDKIQAVGVNIAEKATMIWNVADMLRGPFKPHEYGLVILPMTVVKRFHDCLLPTHEAVLAQYEKVKKLAVIDGFLTKASGYQFYNCLSLRSLQLRRTRPWSCSALNMRMVLSIRSTFTVCGRLSRKASSWMSSRTT